MIDRKDLISDSTLNFDATRQRQDAESLLNCPASGKPIAVNYLAGRLGCDPVMPSTRYAGIPKLRFFKDKINQNNPNDPNNVIDDHPCAVFEMRWQSWQAPELRGFIASRIWLAKDGKRKADFGVDVKKVKKFTQTKPRAKDAKRVERKPGQSVIFGNETAPWAVPTEGIENGCAVATAFRAEIEAGTMAVFAQCDANGLSKFVAGPFVTKVTVAADRDITKANKRNAGLDAAVNCAKVAGARAQIALPGVAGQKTDWNEVFVKDGPQAVRDGILAAVAIDALAGGGGSGIPPQVNAGGGGAGASGGRVRFLLDATDDHSNANEVERILSENNSLIYRSGDAITRVAKAISERTKVALAAAKARGVRLGGDPRNLIGRSSQGATASAAVRKAAAKARDADHAQTVAECRAEGATTLRQIAACLEAKRLTTPRGGKSWSPMQVKLLLANIEA